MNALEILTVVFVILKLVGVISWSWWWVLAPTWLAWVVFAVLLGLQWSLKKYR